MPKIFTIGHSNHSTQHFIDLLRRNDITAIADVRSSPRTRINPDFSQPLIERVLSNAGINYVFLGEELGARSQDETCYEKGKVKYERLAKQSIFQDGLDRVEMGAEKHRIALLCAEKEPLHCHRCILISRHLVDRRLNVSHILSDGSTETHDQTIERLMDSLGLLTQREIFQTEDELRDLAYSLQEQRIAYAVPEQRIPDLVA